MKKVLTFGAMAYLALSAYDIAKAQSQSTALLLSTQTDARGSARYQALSGAMGAVGVDFSSVHQNPAGISLFRSGMKVSATLNNTTRHSNNQWYGNKTNGESFNRFYIDELSYMTSWRLANGKNITLGFGLQSNGRFDRELDAFTGEPAGGLGSSLTNYIAGLTTASDAVFTPGDLNAGAYPHTVWKNPWGSVLGYTSRWIDADIVNRPDGSPSYHYNSAYGRNPQRASLINKESGGVSNFDLALGFELSSSFSLGFMATFSTLSYDAMSYYHEGFGRNNVAGQPISLSLDNSMSLEGFGAKFGVGILLRPLDGLRLGASIYTPNFASYKMNSWARATGVDNSPTAGKGREDVETPNSYTNFGMHSPWRFGLSGAYVIGRTAIVSADYEYQDLGGARLRNSTEDNYEYSRNIYEMENNAIKSDFGGQHTLRLGFELNATKRLALRAGMRYSSAPKYDYGLDGETASLELLVPSTLPHYRLPGSLESYSLGLGYRLSPSWTLDVAYVLRKQNDRVASYPFFRDNATKEPFAPMKFIEDKQTQHSLSATISYRF